MARETVFLNRMTANDTETTVAYGMDDKVMHQVDRTPEQDEAGYSSQIAFERGEPDQTEESTDESTK